MKRFFILLILFLTFILPAKSASDTAETIYAKAYGDIYRNNPKEAIRLFEKGQSIFPDCAFLYAGMGDAYLKEGNFDKALECYTIAQRKKYTLDIYKIDFYNASLQKTMQSISSALNELFVAAKNSDNPVLYRNINYIMMENYSKTSLLTEIYQNTADDNLNQVNAVKNSGKNEAALLGYLKILNANPKNFQAANNAGVTLFELKDYQLAEKYLLQALAENSNSPVILNNLGVVNLYQEDYVKMEEYFANALIAKNDYTPVLNNIAVAKIHKGLRFYKSKNVASILDIIEKNNEDYYAMRTLAKMYFVKSDFKSASNILQYLNSTYNFKLYTQKAYTSLKADEYDVALEYINKAITLYSDNSIDYEIRGRIYASLGRYEEAQADYRKAVDKNKKNCTVYYYIARTFAASGDKVAAANAMKEFISVKKGNPNSTQIKLLFE